MAKETATIMKKRNKQKSDIQGRLHENVGAKESENQSKTREIKISGIIPPPSCILELDIHGLNKFQAKTYIDSRLKSAGREIYRIRVVHGYHSGTGLKEMVKETYKSHPKVLRLEYGLNLGTTDLVLREFI